MSSNRKQYQFITVPPEELTCTICLEVAIEPHQHEECGNLFCGDCLIRYCGNKESDKPCPSCRIEGKFYVDKRGIYIDVMVANSNLNPLKKKKPSMISR